MVARVALLVILSALLIDLAQAVPAPSPVRCSTTTLQDIATFFLANYVAHAATIPTAAGAKWYDTAFWTVFGLFLPYSGLGRALGLIWRHLAVGPTSLEKAAARDALLVVVRSDGWEPTEQPEELYMKIPDNFHDIDPGSVPYGRITFCGVSHAPDHFPVDHRHITLHGAVALPNGYMLAFPSVLDLGKCFPSGNMAMFDLGQYFPFESKTNRSIVIGRSQSWLKVAASVAQLVYTSITIYRARGDQLDQYGYAAFGLSVFPYTIMSLVNLLCVGLVGEYPCSYMLRTPIMCEAERRGGSFYGAVGILDDKVDAEMEMEVNDAGQESSNNIEHGLWARYSQAKVSLVAKESPWDEGDLLDKILVVEVGDITRRFRYTLSNDSGSPPPAYEFQMLPHANQGAFPHGCSQRSTKHPRLTFYSFIVFGLVALALPSIFIAFLTQYRAGRSTVAERSWMMAWLYESPYVFFAWGIISLLIPHVSPSWLEALTAHGHVGPFVILGLFWGGMLIPAIGGFVTVGRMLKDYGTCSPAS